MGGALTRRCMTPIFTIQRTSGNVLFMTHSPRVMRFNEEHVRRHWVCRIELRWQYIALICMGKCMVRFYTDNDNFWGIFCYFHHFIWFESLVQSESSACKMFYWTRPHRSTVNGLHVAWSLWKPAVSKNSRRIPRSIMLPWDFVGPRSHRGLSIRQNGIIHVFYLSLLNVKYMLTMKLVQSSYVNL